ncbi:MAG: hypothetical protein QGH23_07245 [Dehalococcoidia bacterium]|jgi:hypothetical protein|nr:hypothetical protein [Dehalococcoidia bacterium]MDP6510983.1 hypothetical protein [Dehalococcoidia bacterium]MDP6782174.1 hypothetical protein [Dehalococcoidia bacterium]
MSTIFPRPEERELFTRRQHLPGMTCPKCHGKNIAEYPALKVTGWAVIQKCQDCFHELGSHPTRSPLGTNYIPWSSLLPEGEPDPES